ncbi:MAG: hypothetical protein HY764_00365 [Candidatus Portnoybacteria bacterium]|nr:hypothetical protein [Candidatus Portnoybacteria bacterium]
MESKWYELKPKAEGLRRKGYSIGHIERNLKIPRSTLSGWLRNIQLTSQQKKRLFRNWKNALINARKKAVLWHNTQKAKRLEEAKNSAIRTLKSLGTGKNVVELALAFLYLGEGRKNSPETAIGSSDPMILKFFLAAIKNTCNLDIKKIKCELALRADQDPKKIRRFWSKELRLPIENFKQVNIDKRTEGSKTYPHYKGVCHLRCSHAAIQRKLLNIATLFCQNIIDKHLGA